LYLFVSKGLCYNQIGKNEQAKESLLKAIQIDSTSSPALGNLGWIYYCLGDYQKCITYSQRAIRYQNDAFYAMFNIAISTLRLGKYDESVDLYKKYIDLGKKNNKEDFDGAIADLRDLIKQNILVKESTYIIENVFQRKE
jgi:tetratricopeptide (TPR) repeat protein